jgi:hypothetical protein
MKRVPTGAAAIQKKQAGPSPGQGELAARSLLGSEIWELFHAGLAGCRDSVCAHVALMPPTCALSSSTRNESVEKEADMTLACDAMCDGWHRCHVSHVRFDSLSTIFYIDVRFRSL